MIDEDSKFGSMLRFIIKSLHCFASPLGELTDSKVCLTSDFVYNSLTLVVNRCLQANCHWLIDFVSWCFHCVLILRFLFGKALSMDLIKTFLLFNILPFLISYNKCYCEHICFHKNMYISTQFKVVSLKLKSIFVQVSHCICQVSKLCEQISSPVTLSCSDLSSIISK